MLKSIDNWFRQILNQINTNLTTNTSTLNTTLTTINDNIIDSVPKSVFREVLTTENVSIVSGDFLYNTINSQLFNTLTGTGGNLTVVDSIANLNITNSVGSYIVLRTNKVLKYTPGVPNVVRLSYIFDTPVALSTQRCGIGIATNELSFGYDGVNFGIVRGYGGEIHQVKLTITTATTGVENATITLNSVAYTVALTNAGGVIGFTCAEIAEDATIQTLWNISTIGSDVIFTYLGVGARSGTYTFSSATAVGSFTTLKTGADLTTDWVYEANFNVNSALSQSLDKTKGNVYQISYAWLGFSAIVFSVMNPTTGNIEEVHRILYTNNYETTSLNNPNMFIQCSLASLGSSTAMSCKTASLAGFSQAVPARIREPFFSFLNSKTGTTEFNVLALKCRYSYGNLVNQSRVLINRIAVVVDGTKTCIVRVIKNPTIVATSTTDYPQWTFIDSNDSMMYSDIVSDTYSGGKVVNTILLDKEGKFTDIIDQGDLTLTRGEILLITCTSASATICTSAVSWVEDI